MSGVKLWLIVDNNYRSVLPPQIQLKRHNLKKNTMCTLNGFFTPDTQLISCVLYIQHNSSKQQSANLHVLLYNTFD